MKLEIEKLYVVNATKVGREKNGEGTESVR